MTQEMRLREKQQFQKAWLSFHFPDIRELIKEAHS